MQLVQFKGYRSVEVTTLFAIGRVLAYERILLWDGVYLQLRQLKKFDPTLGPSLRTLLLQMDQMLDNGHFQRYHRLALAEMVTARDTDHLRTSTYLEFKQIYYGLTEAGDQTLQSAKYFLRQLHRPESEPDLNALIKTLQAIDEKLQMATQMPTTISDRI